MWITLAHPAEWAMHTALDSHGLVAVVGFPAARYYPLRMQTPVAERGWILAARDRGEYHE